MRIKGYGEGLLDVCGQVGKGIFIKLPDGDLPALMT